MSTDSLLDRKMSAIKYYYNQQQSQKDKKNKGLRTILRNSGKISCLLKGWAMKIYGINT
jgi:hypothetical protein